MSIENKKPELSIVISGYNEEKFVVQVLTGVLGFLEKNNIDGEIIFLNNHSIDKTGELAAELEKKHNQLRVIQRYNRPSKDLGSSLREGLSKAMGNYVLIMDCDASHDYNEINNLYEKRNEADIIIGSRYVAGGRAELNWKRWLFSTSYNLFARIFAGVNVKDMTTGFKLYKREVLQNMNLTNNGFGLHVELMLKAAAKGCTWKEVPITYRKSGKSHLNYRKQFWSYVKPVLEMFWMRVTGRKYV